MIGGARDRTLIDTLEGLPCEPLEMIVWRVVRDTRDPTIFSSGGNRWDDGSFEVLYTSLSREGALAEMRFHLGRGQPVVPSKLKYRLFALSVKVSGAIDLCGKGTLEKLGVDMASFGKLPYLDRIGEYETCQKIGEAIHFLGSDSPGDPTAMLVPNARYDTRNLVLLSDYTSPGDVEELENHGIIDWSGI
ncbi:RES domain-containing protein [Altericroceibacterium spongiae]|uniref:RES domain-containing protein n=1 Tax=Altericroceibacterium spongiae TaxID=2320269 RepID=A0A420EJ84_9SPHN|nr:RES family NAD+ phosphorylase [Altericroceibacterium spongiae]RKF20779.1 RES domain-containing protein [Altericroceibacterium spongiae]